MFIFHRELPGFGSTRLLLGTVSQELDSWRIHVETAISDIYDHYSKTANVLATKLMAQVTNALRVSIIMATIIECVELCFVDH